MTLSFFSTLQTVSCGYITRGLNAFLLNFFLLPRSPLTDKRIEMKLK